MATAKPRKYSPVWVVHGRNTRLNEGVFTFLESLGLTPLRFSDARGLTKKQNPYIGEILDAALKHTSVVVALLTPDDKAKLRPVFCSSTDPPHERQFSNQPRMNVIFEAGMAAVAHRGHTIFVQIGQVKPFSDLGGIFILQMDGSKEKRKDFVRLLAEAGCPVTTRGTAWQTAGDLNPNPKPAMPAAASLKALHGRNIKDTKEFQGILDYSGGVIDQQAYGSYRHYEPARIPRGLSLTWIDQNPDIYTFLMDRKTSKPAGYINAMPLEEEWYQRVRSGCLRDNQIQADGIVPFIPNSQLRLYLMSIAIERKYRQFGDGLFQRGYIKLLNAFLEKLIFYARKKRVRVTHFLATAWTSEGQKLCKLFGMTPVAKDQDGDVVYELDLSTKTTLDNIRILPRLKQLFALYRKML